MLHCNYCDYHKKLAAEQHSPRNPFLCELMKIQLDAEIVTQAVEHPCSRVMGFQKKDVLNAKW